MSAHADYVARVVATAPPLSTAQASRLQALILTAAPERRTPPPRSVTARASSSKSLEGGSSPTLARASDTAS